MWADLAIGLGLSALRSGMQYDEAKTLAKDKKAWQTYKNTMTKLADGNNQNVLTTNKNMAIDRSAQTAFQIERSEYLTSAQVEVSAAASGTGGRSVNMVMFDVERNASVARARNQDELEAQFMQIDNQRYASTFQAATQMDYSPIPEPNAASHALGFATDAFKTYSTYSRTSK